jgi:serine/threonine-protein kinase HipA
MICSSCLKNNKEEFCLKCRKELFDGKKVSKVLGFDSPFANTSGEFLDHTKKISISGVQVKYSLKLGKQCAAVNRDWRAVHPQAHPNWHV